MWAAALIYVTAVPNAAGYIAANHTGASGWRLHHTAAGLLQFDTNSGTFIAPTRALAAGDLNKAHLFVGQWGGSTDLFVRTYFERAQVGSGVAAASYSPTGANRTSFGVRENATSPAHSGVTLCGLVGGDSALKLAEVQALYDAVKVAGDVVSVPGKTTHLWSVKQDAVGASFPGTLDDKVGSSDMTFYAGAASGIDLTTVANPTWSW
jgi:hypothetical protein